MVTALEDAVMACHFPRYNRKRSFDSEILQTTLKETKIDGDFYSIHGVYGGEVILVIDGQ